MQKGHDLHSIYSVKVVGEYALELTFEDGVTKTVDLSGSFFGSLFNPLKDPNFFRQITLNEEVRTIEWPNGADYDPETLYNWDEYADWFRKKAREFEVAYDCSYDF
ncbi:MAG TPA: DUF2442 domain-containing protein [Candidatus Kapabacteria bacterium]|nr:DUF2442 domain-containing protein [Candidatus Kapabacteria bacterium]